MIRRVALITTSFVAVALAALALAGCGSGSGSEQPTAVSVFFLRGDRVGPAARVVAGDRVAGALEALLDGPSDDERGWGLETAFPADVRLLGVEVADGVVTVDLSRELDDGASAAELRARLAQLVFTATQFPDAQAVRLHLDGEAVRSFTTEGVLFVGEQTREDFEASAPQILVERPLPGETVESPFHLAGSANAFEATFLYELVGKGGEVLAGTFVTATCGSGCRGTFDVPVAFDAGGDATLRVFERSAEDGAVVNLVEIPLRLG